MAETAYDNRPPEEQGGASPDFSEPSKQLILRYVPGEVDVKGEKCQVYASEKAEFVWVLDGTEVPRWKGGLVNLVCPEKRKCLVISETERMTKWVDLDATVPQLLLPPQLPEAPPAKRPESSWILRKLHSLLG